MKNLFFIFLGQLCYNVDVGYMDIVEFNKTLVKALDIVDIGIRKGYFDESRKGELNKKLISIIKKGVVYDLPGTAIYGMYSSGEKKLYFNAKVFESDIYSNVTDKYDVIITNPPIRAGKRVVYDILLGN